MPTAHHGKYDTADVYFVLLKFIIIYDKLTRNKSFIPRITLNFNFKQ